MKKLILINAILLQVTLLLAQGSFQMLSGDGSPIENGQTIEVMVTDLSAFETVSEEYFLRNNSTTDVNVRMRMESMSLVTGAEFSFCALGGCYPPNITETASDFLVTAETTVTGNGVFTGHYHPHDHIGTSVIKYTFYNVDNTDDTISFKISFNGSSLLMLTDSDVRIMNGETIEVEVSDFSAFETVSDEYFVMNNSTSDLNIRMRMEAVSLVNGAEYSFCALGSCFPAGVNETSRDYFVPANTNVGNEGLFTGHYHPHDHIGTSIIRYTFYNVDDLNDTTSFMIMFNGGSGTGINNIDENAIVNAFPNPATSSLFIQYDLEKISGTYLKIYNSIGEIVIQKEVNSTSGILKLDVSSLAKGVYVYRLESTNQSTKTNKIIIK